MLAAQIKNISLNEARKDFKRLQSTTATTNSRAGLKAVDAFTFALRLETRSSEGVSFEEWRTPERLAKPYIHKLIQYGLQTKSPAAAEYTAFCLYSGSGSISSFPPVIAKRLFETYKPTRILDPTAGWGGRLLAAMSRHCSYVGLDTNSRLVQALRCMAATLSPSADTKFLVANAATADYSALGPYDMVFTSPPYYTKSRPTEIYAEMPAYESRADFNNRFFIPMIKASWAGLSNGGTFALNIPQPMLAVVETLLGKPVAELPMRLTKRSVDAKYTECIYVWKKCV